MAPRIIECDQGSPEWFAARLGLPTASEFSVILSEGKPDGHLPQHIMDAMVKSGCTAEQLAAAVKAAKKKYSGGSRTRKSYMNRLAAEIITGEPGESFQSQAMERGKAMEEEARDHYAFVHGEKLERVGFIVNGRMGASPDSLIGAKGGVEIKTEKGELIVDTIVADAFPNEHKAQVQGNMLVSDREWWDLVVYWPKMPPFVKRAYRDEPYIANLRAEISRFNEELDRLVAKIRNYGKEAIAA